MIFTQWQPAYQLVAVRLLVVVLVAVISACSDSGQPTGEKQVQIRVVVTEPVAEMMLRTTVEISGEVRPWAAVTVAAEAAGRVIELQTEVGDAVAAGQVVARLDDDQARARLEVARAEVARAEAGLIQAKRDLTRGEQLAATNDISEVDLESLHLAHDTIKAQLAAARASMDLAEQALADSVIRAPFAGTVAARMVEIGSWISPGAPVIRLLDQSRVKVAGAASQRDRARLRDGMTAEIHAPALPGESFSGNIRLLGQEAEAATGTYLVELAVSDPTTPSGSRLLAGMQVSVIIALGAHRAIAIPRQTLVSTTSGEGVFIVNNGIAHFKAPELGEVHELLVEIRSGLQPGDRVVTSGQHVLVDGCQVREEE
jgi:membrane fusion protein (multidrug efflux system)